VAVKGNFGRGPSWHPGLLGVLGSLATLATLAGTCRPEPPDGSAASDGRANIPEDSSVTAGLEDSLRFEIEVPPAARIGEPVSITLRVRNLGKTPRELNLAGRPTAFDVTVTRTDGSVVWRRLEGATIPGILGIQVLAPGGMLEFKETWDQRTRSGEPAGPGLFMVEGALLTDSPTPLKIGPASLRLSPQ
jgi:hypothetical protein